MKRDTTHDTPFGFMIRPADSRHAMLSDWGISNISSVVRSPQTILDTGCANGRNTNILLQKYPRARVTALADSSTDAERAVRYNAREIAEDRCAVITAGSALPFPDGYFDLVTAFENEHIMQSRNLREIYRVLKPGGVFALVNISDNMPLTPRKAAGYLKKAGFEQIKGIIKRKNNWLTITAHKGA